MDYSSQPSWLEDIGLLRLAGFLEGATLITLLFVAVPMKRLLGEPGMVSIMGPVHGGAFVLYFVMAISVVFGRSFTTKEIARIVVAALVPFGTFVNDRFLARKHREATDDL